MLPRCYRFDGSTGMDLRPAAVLEAEDARRTELRRRHEPMAVTTRIRMVGQPPGGLLPLSLFDHMPLADRMGLHPRSMETVAPDLAGLYVDYMTRLAMGASKRVAFRIPLLGARLVNRTGEAEALLARIVDFTAPSARAACLLLDFDAASRRGPQYWKPRRMVPDDATYFNLTRMVARSRAFFDEYGPVVWDGFDFEGGYTDRITSGSGDFLTADTLWDFKVSSYRPNPMYTLQLLVYWRMGLHSVHDEYRMVRRLGFFNPRRDEVWLLDVDRIDDRLVDWTDHELIGYPKD